MKKTRNRQQASKGSKQTSFLPEPDFNPKLPPRNTLIDVTLQILLEGGRITSLDFQNRTASQRLAAYVHELNKLGWPVKANDVAVIVNEKPEIRIVSQYYLEEKSIQQFNKYLGVRNGKS